MESHSPHHDRDGAGALAFGRHVFDPQRCELRTAGGPPVALGQRAGRLLQALLEESGRVLSRDDLVRRVWPGRDIDDGNLRVQIAALRRALAEDRALIGTVAGRGYLFAGRAERRAPFQPRLPYPTASLVGRGALVGTVLARLAATRFVTLAGAPGIGKTALALAAAHRHCGGGAGQELAGATPEEGTFATAYRHGGATRAEPAAVHGGAAWAELDGAATEEGMLAAVAGALGLDPRQRWTAVGLAARLPAAGLLLVLDNCEHLADACSRLAETLLAACPRLAVLATSRQPLLAAGETVVRVPALELPVQDDTDAARLAGSAAVELFVVRAAAADAAFAPDAAALATVAAICRRLDGLPLAIELAAAQVPGLGLQRVAAGLDDMARLLQGGRRSATPRHRTLRAALDWSYVLLPPPAQAALRRLAAMPSPFTLDEAVELLRAEQSTHEAIDSLAVLAAHSLLAVEHGRQTRFRLLATTRPMCCLSAITEGSVAQPIPTP